MEIKNIEKFNKLPQRQKKFAKTKIALLTALLEGLKTKPLSAIMIKNLAKSAEISEPTFFNYFDSKVHMLVYFIQIWSIDMNAIGRNCEHESPSYLESIKNIFIKTAQENVLHPKIMLEIISFQAQDVKLELHDISDGEKWLMFEDIANVETLDGAGLETILPALIKKAQEGGELGKDVDTGLLFLTLSSLFFGTSLLLLKRDPKNLPDTLESQLNFIFEKVKS
ncbi:MAG: hypothetical protein L3J53_00325 [Proteobacteria bacterium]|nr:hypothetical protein [Pseudomonadota bacterium]